MKYFIPLILLIIGVNAYSYNPKLVLLGQINDTGKLYLDHNAHQKIRASFKQAVIYEKYAQPVTIENKIPYQSVIKQLIVNCADQSIAIRSGDYFSGQTSKSALVKKFDDITLSHDGETGAAFYSFDDLEFKPLNQGKFYLKIYENTCKNEK